MIAGTVVGLALFYLLVVRGRFRGPSLDLRAIEEREARKVR